eukprot:m.51263 g.51263  ORF g.51263 m.51263 type:complete len:260 (+) comp10722_c1_seq1:226-1005(+)
MEAPKVENKKEDTPVYKHRVLPNLQKNVNRTLDYDHKAVKYLLSIKKGHGKFKAKQPPKREDKKRIGKNMFLGSGSPKPISLRCHCCGDTETRTRRRGPGGVTLCNACGIRWLRHGVCCKECKYIPKNFRGLKRCPKCGKGLLENAEDRPKKKAAQAAKKAAKDTAISSSPVKNDPHTQDTALSLKPSPYPQSFFPGPTPVIVPPHVASGAVPRFLPSQGAPVYPPVAAGPAFIMAPPNYVPSENMYRPRLYYPPTYYY